MEFCRHGLAMVRSMYTGVSKLRVKGQNLLGTQHRWPWHPVPGGKWERTKARNTRIINVINKELLDPSKEQGVTSSTHCVPRHSYKTDSPPWLPAPNGIKHFYCRVSCHFSSPAPGYRDSPSPPPRRMRRAPAERLRDSPRPGLWLVIRVHSWLLIGCREHRELIRPGAGWTARPNIPKSSSQTF